jgi:hypothetical protein
MARFDPMKPSPPVIRTLFPAREAMKGVTIASGSDVDPR